MRRHVPPNSKVKSPGRGYREIHSEKKVRMETSREKTLPGYRLSKNIRRTEGYSRQNVTAIDDDILQMMHELRMRAEEKDKINNQLYHWK